MAINRYCFPPARQGKARLNFHKYDNISWYDTHLTLAVIRLKVIYPECSRHPPSHDSPVQTSHSSMIAGVTTISTIYTVHTKYHEGDRLSARTHLETPRQATTKKQVQYL